MPVDLSNTSSQQLQTWGAKQGSSAVYMSDRGNTGVSTLKGRTFHLIGKNRRENTKAQLIMWANKQLSGDLNTAKQLAEGLFDVSDKKNVTGKQVAEFAKRVATAKAGHSNSNSIQLDSQQQVSSRQSFQVDSQKSVKFNQISQTNTSALPRNHRHQVMVGMGQGAIGKLDQTQLYTDSLQTCYAVVIRNEQTGMGGIFHVPAHHTTRDRDASMQDLKATMPPESRAALKEMIALIQPTDIQTVKGLHSISAIPEEMQTSLDRDDIAALEQQDQAAKGVLADLCSEVGMQQTPAISTHGIAGTAVVTQSDAGGVEIESSRADQHNGQTNMFEDEGVISDDTNAVGWSTMSKNEARGGLIDAGGSKLLEPRFRTAPPSAPSSPNNESFYDNDGSINVDALPELP